MKKTFVLFSALATLLCGMMFNSCDAAEDFVAPKDTWVYKTGTGDNSFTYKWTSGETEKSVSFDVYVNYATKDGTIAFGESKTEETIKEGLNVILVPKAETGDGALSELLGATSDQLGEIAIFKAFGTSAEASEDGSTSATYSIGSTAWTLIYNFNNFESMGTKSMSNTLADLTLLSDVKNLNWKRVLYNMLGDKILGE